MINFCNEAQIEDGRQFMVFYAVNPPITFNEVSIKNIGGTHRYVGTAFAVSIESVFHGMQGEIWSPNGEARPLILAAGLSHTSMSVGDVVFDVENNEWLYCSNFGWKFLTD